MDEKVWASCGEVEYIRLPPERVQEGLEVLNEGFYPHESVCRAVGIASAPEAVDDLNRLCVGVVEDGVSMIAVDKKTNRVAGVAFNKLQVNSNDDEAGYFEKFSNTCKHPASRRLMEAMIEADALCNLFERCNTDCLLEIMFLSVHPEYRKRNIGLKLCEVSMELARTLQQGVAIKTSSNVCKLSPKLAPGAVCALFTSPVSQKIGMKLGMTVAARLAYADIHFNGKSFGDVLEPNNKDIAVVYKILK
ncbi:unnamed protein product [Callosobruchus maculatus]|uniref:N-acetyltransferase domain-containing protein n=1 Tax=Callosobruchus maculatus TaxID=64391 RepID=A0A653CMY5_CALMS|nr:unnamed protein product [Callosobruchus maculatus]